MAPLTLRLLGNPEVTVGQQPLSFPTRKVLALLIYLVVERGMHSRESLMALLWPESPSKNAAVTLRGTLSRLRKSLQAAGQFLVSEAGKVGFDAVLDKDSPATIDMVPIFVADGHLQLALGNPERTLGRMKDVIQRLHHVGSRYYLAEALWLQGKAWLALEKVEQAKEALREAKAVAEDINERSSLWRILATLSDLERMSGNEPEAETLRRQAQEILVYIADHAGSEALRASFVALPEVQAVS